MEYTSRSSSWMWTESYFGCRARVDHSSVLHKQRSDGKSAEIYDGHLLFCIYKKEKPGNIVNLNDQSLKKMRIKRERKEFRVCIAIHVILLIILHTG